MQLLFGIAFKHLVARKRQSLVSLLGIVLGVGFFLAISALMQGSQKDFIRRLVDNSPHITIVDEFRNPHRQPVEELYGSGGALELRSLKPLSETRGIRGYEQIIDMLKMRPELRASPLLKGQALVSAAGRDFSITLSGILPNEFKGITTIEKYMRQGSLDKLQENPDGIILGYELMRKLSLNLGDNISVAATTGQVRTFKILGIFRTGRSDFDERQGFASLKRVQALLNRSHRANNIVIRAQVPEDSYGLAQEIERTVGYKTTSWQELSEDLLNTLVIRNIIMYSVVSAVLIVAAFGIYNVISTIVMEKHRDIAILKSMGFLTKDIKRIFLVQGFTLGLVGCCFGLPLGMLLMFLLMQIEMQVPGSSDPIPMPVDWGILQFLIAAAFAMTAAVFAALLPAHKGAKLKPVDILRGGM